MKQYRYVNSEQSIASFMVGFDRDKMTYEEYLDWSEYLKDALTTDEHEAVVYYGANELERLERAVGGSLFVFGDETIRLAFGKTIQDLDYDVLSYIDVDTLLAIIDAIDAYSKQKQSEPGE